MAWVIVKTGGDGYNHGKAHMEMLIESADDLEDADFPSCAPGSVAYTADFSVLAVKNIDSSWQVNE